MNKCLKFDGVNDYVDCGNAGDGDYSEMTIEAWIKMTSTIPSSWRTPLHRNDGTSVGSSVFFIGLEATSHQIVSTIGAGSGLGWTAGATGVNAQVDTWYYVVNSWDGTTARVYVNGVERKQYALSSDNFSNKPAATTRIGASGDGTGYLFKGAIDEVRIYNRALTAEEVLASYRGLYVSRTGLVGEWLFQDNVLDTSGEGNNGTLYGAVYKDVPPRIVGVQSITGINQITF